MRLHPARRLRPHRRAVAAVELAVLLPFLAFLFVIAVDYARIFYFGVTLENCARNGAYFASNYPNANYLYNDIYGYKTLDDAVLNDASNLWSASTPGQKPTYTVRYGAAPEGPFTGTKAPDSGGYVHVEVTWTFHSITNYAGVPSQVQMTRAATMKMAPAMPAFP